MKIEAREMKRRGRPAKQTPVTEFNPTEV